MGEYVFFGHNVCVLAGVHEVDKFGLGAGLWVPRIRSRHATSRYSCMRPLRRSRRRGRTVAPRPGGSAAGWRVLME